MRNVFLIVFFGLFFISGFAQFTKSNGANTNTTYLSDSTQYSNQRKVTIDGKTSYKDYKVISINNDTTIIDTVLNVQKQYKFNYLRKDNFELMEFHNQGSTFNKLGYIFQGSHMLPSIGFNAKQFSYYTLNDISYYYVPTPTSELMYKKGIKQGQVLDALLTANTSRQFNISVAYKGLRSLGRYQNELASQKNFRATFNYHTKNKRYYVRGNMYSFDIYNDQNGGLTPESIIYFENNNPDYKDRGRLEVNFTDADNTLEGKRYYMDQVVTLFSNRKFDKKPKKSQLKTPSRKSIPKEDRLPLKKDSLHLSRKDSTTFAIKQIDSTLVIDSLAQITKLVKNDSISMPAKSTDSLRLVTTPSSIDTLSTADIEEKHLFNLQLGNSLMYETKHYRFNQTTANSFFGDAFQTEIGDHTSYQTFDGELNLQLYSIYTGSLKFKTNYFNYNYHYSSILFYDDYTITDRLHGDAFSVGGEWVKTFGGLQLKADASTILFGTLHGNTLKTAISYQMDSLFDVQGYAEFTSKSPDFNKQLYQSDYIDFNWQNNFGNEKITTFGGAFNSKKWASAEVSYNIIGNYTYFNEESKPEQASETLNYFKIKLLKEFTVGKFSLDNTVMYQSVLTGESFFRVPTWNTRNTLYFSTDMFKGNPLYLQTGITFKYFSKYKMDAYNPLISEFYLQNTDEIGNFPMFDFFFNMRIQRTRFYLQFENITSSFTGRNYYSAPTYPSRDFTFRIGLVWNFFI